ncbi:MAG: alpha/beta hydrolase [Chloroflexota bacterium]|nr:MAG: alpha/beta hydrolase [Chloroflexota bacterium]
MPSTTRAVPVPGGTLHAVADGDGPPILLFHAWVADLRAWDPVVPVLVAGGYRAVRFDARGFGSSTTEDVEISHHADGRAVLDALGIRQAALVGNSRGARTALDLIVETPERAVALTWIGGGIGGFEGGETPEELAIWERIEAVEATGDLDALNELEVQLWVDGPGQPAGRAPRWIRDAVGEMNRPTLEPDHVTGRPIALDPPADERLSEIRIPVLAVVGALDTSGTQAAAVRLEGAVAGARRVVIPDAAHMVGMEVPETVAGLILDLVRPLGSWS